MAISDIAYTAAVKRGGDIRDEQLFTGLVDANNFIADKMSGMRAEDPEMKSAIVVVSRERMSAWHKQPDGRTAFINPDGLQLALLWASTTTPPGTDWTLDVMTKVGGEFNLLGTMGFPNQDEAEAFSDQLRFVGYVDMDGRRVEVGGAAVSCVSTIYELGTHIPIQDDERSMERPPFKKMTVAEDALRRKSAKTSAETIEYLPGEKAALMALSRFVVLGVVSTTWPDSASAAMSPAVQAAFELAIRTEPSAEPIEGLEFDLSELRNAVDSPEVRDFATLGALAALKESKPYARAADLRLLDDFIRVNPHTDWFVLKDPLDPFLNQARKIRSSDDPDFDFLN